MQADNDTLTGDIASASNYDVVAVPGGFSTSFFVASAFFGLIIGAKGSTKSRIERETDTKITIPRKGSGNITIRGKNRESVCETRKQVESIMSMSRKKLSPTHFTNFRVTDEGIKSNFERFVQEVLEGIEGIDGLTEAMIVPTIKLHITINVMTLLDDDEISRAAKLLDDCLEKVIIPAKNEFGAIAMKVSGVKVFGDANPKKVNVLFGRIESDSMQQIADGIMEYFIAEGVSKRERNRTSVQMHMTLIKAGYDKESSDKDGNGNAMPRRRPNKTFDASSLLEKYANYDFGCQEVSEILLCAMSEKDDEGFYKKIASVKF